MRPRLRTLYAKIFLWFCLTIAVSTTLVLLAAGLAGSQPFGYRFVAVTQDLYARTAVDLYTTGGTPALTRYLDVLAHNSGIEGHLLALPNTTTGVLAEPVPPQDALVLRRAQQTGRSVAHTDRHFWTAASVVGPVPGTDASGYIFLLSSHPLRGFLNGTFLQLVAPRLAVGLLLVALFCLLLARHITKPVRLLQEAATRMAGGDLSVRTLPALPHRSDEFADMAAAFDSMAGRIETLVNTQQQMLADISHELRSPLTRIGVSLELLRRGEADVLPEMEADLDRLNGMIGQILELARFDLQLPAANTDSVDLRAVLEGVAARASYEGQQRNIRVRLDAPQSASVRGSQAALESCFENIVRNALQHSPSGGSVMITLAAAKSGWASVQIDDDGNGVPEAALAEIFRPFYRVPGSGSTHTGGSGLGLSISARIARRCGGSISATNRTPHGLSVRALLPLAPSDPQ
jgi:two-component system sensor histidine kinase CpxA